MAVYSKYNIKLINTQSRIIDCQSTQNTNLPLEFTGLTSMEKFASNKSYIINNILITFILLT
jgi:hypothetical protein